MGDREEAPLSERRPTYTMRQMATSRPRLPAGPLHVLAEAANVLPGPGTPALATNGRWRVRSSLFTVTGHPTATLNARGTVDTGTGAADGPTTNTGRQGYTTVNAGTE